jgi:AcrR family transcriptional regulator
MVTAHLRPTSPRLNAEDRRQQILEAATELFAGKGFRGTTTREIAELAHVNEAIIFRHFQSKEELYGAVIEHVCRSQRESRAMEELVAEDLPVAEALVRMAREFLRSREGNSGLSRLLLFSALEQHELSVRFFRAQMAEFYESTARYIERQVEAGRLRQVDAALAARAFWGMLVFQFMLQELFGGSPEGPRQEEAVCRKLVDIWLEGMLPAGAGGAGTANSPAAETAGKAESQEE